MKRQHKSRPPGKKYGISRMKSLVGTAYYVAPEVILVPLVHLTGLKV